MPCGLKAHEVVVVDRRISCSTSCACDIVGTWRGGWDEALNFAPLSDLVVSCTALPSQSPHPILQICEKGFCCPVNRKLPVLHEQLPAVRFPVSLTEKGLCTPTLGVMFCC